MSIGSVSCFGLRSVAGVLSPAGRGAKLSILIFHRVLPTPDPLIPWEPDARRFEWQVKYLSKIFNVISLSDAVDRLQLGTLPSRAACITFDDGYADNLTVAAPILQRYGLPATVFVAPGYVDGGIMFNDVVIDMVRNTTSSWLDLEEHGLGRHAVVTIDDKLAAIGKILAQLKYQSFEQRSDLARQLVERRSESLAQLDLMLSSQQLKTLRSDLLEIGAHTVNHPILAKLPAAQAQQEILSSKQWLEARLEREVTLFAYPNGKPDTDYLSQHAQMVKNAGFKAAVSTAWGVSTRQSDMFQLPRFTPWDLTEHAFFARLLLNLRQTNFAIAH